MDRHSEMEVKFDARSLGVGEYISWMNSKFPSSIRSYMVVKGWDAYWKNGDKIVRHRCDGRRQRSVLTVKQRKTQASILDRHEVDLPQADSVTAGDVSQFLHLSGWSPLFKIHKVSYIFHVENDSADICIALYDVQADAGSRCGQDWGRFLEVEIERDSKCDPEAAQKILTDYSLDIQRDLWLDAPLNSSLLEIFRPKAAAGVGFEEEEE